MKIGIKLLAIILIVSLGPMVGIVILNTNTLTGEIDTQVDHQLNLAAHTGSYYAADLFLDVENMMYELSIQEATVNLAELSLQTNWSVLWDAYEGANWDNEKNMRGNKTAIAWNATNDLNPDYSNYLNEFAIRNGLLEVFMADARGYTFTSSRSYPGDFFNANESWWDATLASQKGNFFKFTFDDSVNAYILEVVNIIKLSTGNFGGMIKGAYNLSIIAEKLNDAILSIGLKEFIADDKGTLYVHENSSLISKNIADYFDNTTNNAQVLEELSMDEHHESADLNEQVEVFLISVGGVNYRLVHSEFETPAEELRFYVLLDNTEIENTIKAEIMNAIYIGGIVGALVALLAIIFARQLTRPILNLKDKTSQISEGDYDINIEKESTDEIGDLVENFKIMVDKMREIIGSSKNMVLELTTAAEELSSSAEEVSSSSESIASSQQQISKGASETVVNITNTQKKFAELSEGIRSIREKVMKINEVSDLIRNIANQTNMLALNAAIEAARAGEAGRGFNVVADQVRKLAEESRKAVATTDTMLKEIIAVTQTQESNSIEMVKSIDGIASVAEETSASTEESAAAAEEQASSMEMITSTAQQLSAIAEQINAQFVGLKITLENESESKSTTQNFSTENDTKADSFENKNQIESEKKYKTTKVLDKSIEITGATINSIVKSFLSDDLAKKILFEALGSKDINPEKFYPAAKFLEALHTIGDRFGQGSLSRVGSKIMESAKWPDFVNNLESALASINEAYKMNHRPNDEAVIGKYGYESKGDQFELHCTNPYPCDFDFGLIKGVMNAFDRKATIMHKKGLCRKNGDAKCVYIIKPGLK